MADASGSCSPSSSSSSNSSNYISQFYDVFLNHRGPDVKKTFATALYRTLCSRGLRVFLDKPEMQSGHDITSQIKTAIGMASAHVAIFSPGYARSKWCLDELELMKNSRGTILPVFYGVKPTELRWTGKDEAGVYAEALREHEKRYDIQTVENWRKALSHAADISGLELAAFNGVEYELLQRVVQRVVEIVPKPSLFVARYPVGLQEKVEELEFVTLRSKQRQDGRAKVVGIVGTGGVGKTTVAKQFFNQKRPLYDRSSFLFDVAKTSLSSLHSKLIKDLKGIDIKIESSEEGLGELNNILSHCYALIVLDNVDHGDQLEALLPIKRVLHPNSLILVTSRDKQILRSGHRKKLLIYHLKGLNPQYSRQLFCYHAFRHSQPRPGYEDVVDGFLKTCKGLPLSLKVLGALVNGKEKSYWKEQLNGLKLPIGIEKRLRVSYDSLEDEEKEIFLDIACFAEGEESDKWIKIWGGSRWKGLVGLENLQDKCLVEVDSKNIIRMHDHLQLMGRNIAQKRSMPVRIWCGTSETVYNLLEQSLYNMTEVRGIRMAPPSIKHNNAEGSYRLKLEELLNRWPPEVFRIMKLQLLEGEGDFVEAILSKVQVCSSNLISLSWNDCSCSSLPPWIPMDHLTVLKVEGKKLERLWDSDSRAPEQLRQLIIDAPLLRFPMSLGKLKRLENIVVKSTRLTTLPDSLGDLRNLQRISLVGCEKLELLPDSLGKLTNLQDMNLSLCKSLRLLPDSMDKLCRTSLKFLNIDSLISLEKLPDWLLKYPYLNCIPTIIEDGHYGFHINLSGFRSLKMLPDSLWNLTPLATINLTGCESLKMLPDIGKFTSISVINLEMCKSLERLPESMGNMINLDTINLTGCESLKVLPDSLGKLRYLARINLEMCTSLEMLPNSLEKLQCLVLKGCCSLTMSTETLGNVTALKCLDLSGCLQMELLPPQVGRQKSLKNLNLLDTKLKELPSDIGSLVNLEVLRLGSPLLEVLPNSLGHLTRLEKLLIHGCKKLQFLPDSIEGLTQLKWLDLRNCGIQNLPQAVMKMNRLTRLAVHRCPLRELPFRKVEGEKEMLQLQVLQLNGTEISEVSFTDGVCPNLQHLSITFCNDLVEVGALPATLISLDLRGCPASKIIGGLCGVPNLLKLDARGCSNIQVEELPGFQTLVSSGLALLNTALDTSDGKEDDVLLEKFCTCPYDVLLEKFLSS